MAGVLSGIINPLANSLNGSQSSGGSISNAGGSNWGYNTAGSVSRAMSQGSSATYGTDASNRAANAAAVANAYQIKNMDKAMEFNSIEAQKQREWQERMANTIYTRSVQNMREAGINPILAASMGLSGAMVGSGATASISTPSAFMGQTFADQNSASSSMSTGDSFSKGESGGSWGSSSRSWNESESGLATGLRQMSQLTEDIYNSVKSSEFMKDLSEDMTNLYKDMRDVGVSDKNKTNEQEKMIESDTIGGTLGYYVSKFAESMRNGIGSVYDWLGLPYSKDMGDIPANTEAGKAAKKLLNGQKLTKEEGNAIINYYKNK